MNFPNLSSYNPMLGSSVNAKYKKKYIKMKRLIKNMVYENAALCDQTSLLQEKIMTAKEEQRFLIKKLQIFEAVAEAESMQQAAAKAKAAAAAAAVAAAANGSSPQTSVVPDIAVPVPIVIPKIIPKIKPPAPKKIKTEPIDIVKVSKASGVKKGGKRKKLVQRIPLDSMGRPVFPIVLGGLTVHSIGEVVTDRPGYHTEDLIYPVGFCSTRIYGSLRSPQQKCVYTCKVIDSATAPRFEIASDNDLGVLMDGDSPDLCHSLLLNHINTALGSEVVTSCRGKGADFFGLSNPTIQNLIQSSTVIRKFPGYPGYKNIRFEVCDTGENLDLSGNDASLSFEALQRSVALAKQDGKSLRDLLNA